MQVAGEEEAGPADLKFHPRAAPVRVQVGGRGGVGKRRSEKDPRNSGSNFGGPESAKGAGLMGGTPEKEQMENRRYVAPPHLLVGWGTVPDKGHGDRPRMRTATCACRRG